MFVLLAWLLAAPIVANAADLTTEGVCAYATGRFGEAASVLRRAVGDGAANQPDFGLRAYFLGRALREAGLPSFARRWLRAAETAESSQWRQLARREESQLDFEAGDRATLLEQFDRGNGEADPEITYLTGLVAAQQRDWQHAKTILGLVSSTSPYYPHARYARAQAEAAEGSFDAALADLTEALQHAPTPKDAPQARLTDRELLQPVDAESGMLRIGIVPSVPAVALRDRALLLRGKIFYVRGRPADARSAFGAVTEGGRTGLDALRGLMLTGGPEDMAEIRAPRTHLLGAALLMAGAAAAAQREDFSVEWRRRVALDDLVHARLSRLERLAADASLRTALEGDLAEFGSRLRRARAQSRWREEEKILPISCTLAPSQSSDEAFRPADEIFYGLWEGSQSDAASAALLDLVIDGRALATDLKTPFERKPFWELWRSGGDERLHYALLAVRMTSLQLRLADHARRFAGLTDGDYRLRRREALDRALRELDGLYAGTAPNDRGARLSTERSAIMEAAGSARGDSTRALIELLGGQVDALFTRSAESATRETDRSRFASELVRELRAQNGSVTAEASSWVQGLIEERRQAEVRFFERVAADNQSALSRAYTRMTAERRTE